MEVPLSWISVLGVVIVMCPVLVVAAVVAGVFNGWGRPRVK